MEHKTIYITILFVILITAIVVYFFVSIIRFHRRYTKLQKERIFAEITIQENERKRIAGDLHDSLGPLLSAVKLNISSMEVQTRHDEELVARANKYLDEIIGGMRQISYNLLPDTLERKGLIEALQEFIAQANPQQLVNIQLYVMKDVKVPKEKQIHVFRILQEIIQNTLKHAKAKNLQIGLSEEDGHLLLLAKDNGTGFEHKGVKLHSPGLGLKSIESRCEILNGTLSLESGIGTGTNYFIKIPLN
jgi:signal transduction histidine kinase